MQEECEEKKCKAGVPDWMVTFSDLMTLLLTFFVLLLSMAENATPKIETGIFSIREAFNGKQIIGDEKSEFSPIDSPVPVNRIQKANSLENKDAVEVEQEEKVKKLDNANKRNMTESDFTNPEMSQAVKKIKEEAKDKEMKETGNQLQMSLDEEVKQGMVSIKSNTDLILIRLPEEPTFKSGKADLSNKIKPALRRIAETLKEHDVDIVVAGYTDDRPIRTARFRSNWDLSAARAVSVAHELIAYGDFAPEQMEVVGHGRGYPLFPNDTPENRAINRRVEINIDLASASISEDEIIRLLEAAKGEPDNEEIDNNSLDNKEDKLLKPLVLKPMAPKPMPTPDISKPDPKVKPLITLPSSVSVESTVNNQTKIKPVAKKPKTTRPEVKPKKKTEKKPAAKPKAENTSKKSKAKSLLLKHITIEKVIRKK